MLTPKGRSASITDSLWVKWLGYQTVLLITLMQAQKPKAIVYCRVSSKEQEDTGYSLDAQKKLLEEHGEKHGFQVVKHFRISESASGKQIRIKFNEMLKYASNNRVSVILCEKVDRLTRNLKDAAVVDDWIKAEDNRQIHCVKENFILSRNTKAHENLVWDMKVAIARFYTNNLSEEVLKGQKEKIAQGWLPTKPPLGYKTIGEKGHKIHIPDEEKAPLIAKMFELYATGNYSIKFLLEEMWKQGLKNTDGNKVGKTRMHKLLSEPFYCGKLRWNGKVSPGNQEPIISEELFEEVQKRLCRKYKNPQYKKHEHVWKAKVECGECGGTVSWYEKKGNAYGECKHYRPCSQRGTTRQDSLEEQLFPLFDKVAPKNERVLGWLEQALKESHVDEIKLYDSQRRNLNEQHEKLQRRLEAIYEDKIDQKITVEFYERKFKEYTEEKNAVLKQLQKLDDGNAQYYEAGYAIHELAVRAKEIYQSKRVTVEDKRLLLSHIFSNVLLKDRKAEGKYTLAFEFLAEWMPKLNNNFELQESGLNKHKTDEFEHVGSMWLRGWGSNPRPTG